MAVTEIRKKGIDTVQEDTRGQGGVVVPVNEVRYTPDEAILDPNSPLAVQIPEGVGADGSRVGMPLADAWREGHVEAKFGTAAAPEASTEFAGEQEGEHGRAIGDTSGAEHTPDHDTVVGPEVHNEPAAQRENDVALDVEKESPASSHDA